MEDKKSIIRVEDLTMAYNENPVIWDVDIDFIEGSRTAIIGPNGAGKSTLLKGILGLMKPITGYVLFWGQPHKNVRRKIAYVPQTETVNWDFPITVLDVVMMGQYKKSGLFHRPGKKEKQMAYEALEQMQMHEFHDRHISDLSGGQKQRVFIARAINQHADLYIMDEPLAGVDKATELIIMNKFKEFQKDNKTVIAVHHDMNTLEDYFDHVVIVNKTIQAQGRCFEVFKDKTPMEYLSRR
ncbi:metal ABC transporter ATP-binding protein [Peptostreptococcus faecalis]|uniref:metal ABC transporter ATP-binding protein n=1 Tax=Peptostreptococcus faecalis TaxID=2045015 RepID=UPI002E8E2983|nr:ABC transporter ATP-binding protein [Peptostreptococcus faecalis]